LEKVRVVVEKVEAL